MNICARNSKLKHSPVNVGAFVRRHSLRFAVNPRPAIARMMFWIVAVWISGYCKCVSFADEPSPHTVRTAKVQLTLRGKAECPSNLLLLSDLVTISGSDSIVQEIEDLPVAPAPRAGQEQTWSREAIVKALGLRGVASTSISWRGASECVVKRTNGNRAPKQERVDSNAKTNSDTVQPATYTSTNDPKNGGKNAEAQKIDRSQFTSAFTTPIMVSQAERIAVEAITNYLQTKTNSDGRWIIKVTVPTEHVALLIQRRQILGVAGGKSPWEGDQEFMLLVKGPNGEQSITLQANVKLPEMVVAANKPLAKGYVLKEEDLSWIQMPRGLQFGPEECVSEIEAVVGKQLRKSMTTQQVLKQADVGPPTLIHVGDIIEIEIVRGSISVQTNGRAVEAGGLDDLIQVDVEPHRSRVIARVRGERNAEVIASGSSKPIANKSNSNSPSIKR